LIDLSINTNQLIIVIAIIAYITTTSILINKFHQYLSNIKMAEAKYRLQLMSETDVRIFINFELQRIKDLKKKAYILMMVIGLIHLIICLAKSSSLLSSGILFLIFIFILAVNYWLKGSSVISSIKNRPGQSDYH